jgi:hypothetical protein
MFIREKDSEAPVAWLPDSTTLEQAIAKAKRLEPEGSLGVARNSRGYGIRCRKDAEQAVWRAVRPEDALGPDICSRWEVSGLPVGFSDKEDVRAFFNDWPVRPLSSTVRNWVRTWIVGAAAPPPNVLMEYADGTIIVINEIKDTDKGGKTGKGKGKGKDAGGGKSAGGGPQRAANSQQRQEADGDALMGDSAASLTAHAPVRRPPQAAPASAPAQAQDGGQACKTATAEEAMLQMRAMVTAVAEQQQQAMQQMQRLMEGFWEAAKHQPQPTGGVQAATAATAEQLAAAALEAQEQQQQQAAAAEEDRVRQQQLAATAETTGAGGPLTPRRQLGPSMNEAAREAGAEDKRGADHSRSPCRVWGPGAVAGAAKN